MHTVNVRRISETHSREEIPGLIADIEPPVSLTETAVQNYIQHGNLAGFADNHSQQLLNPMLIGSSEKRTSIYATVEYGSETGQQAPELMAERVQQLLGHLGLESVIKK